MIVTEAIRNVGEAFFHGLFNKLFIDPPHIFAAVKSVYWQSLNKPYITEILGSHIGESENHSSGFLCCVVQHICTTISEEPACQIMKCHIQNTAILKQISTLVSQSSRLCWKMGKGGWRCKLPRNPGHCGETLWLGDIQKIRTQR